MSRLLPRMLITASVAIAIVLNADTETRFAALIATMEARYGEEAAIALRFWQKLLEQAQDLPEKQQLVTVNDFFNQRIRFVDDKRVWQQSDYWATPAEMLSRGQGDCEDYTIAKYMTLKKLGVDNEKMRLVYVRALNPDTSQQRYRAHMVLAYYDTPTAEPLILDNLSREILQASRRKDLVPVFSFNDEGLWLEVPGGTQRSDKKPEARLSKWRELLFKLKQEGIF